MLLSVGYIFIFILLVSGLAHSRDKRSGGLAANFDLWGLGLRKKEKRKERKKERKERKKKVFPL
jgi:hypothetical protein